MKTKSLLILLLIVSTGLSFAANRSVAFLMNGSSINDFIMDMSSRTGQIEFERSGKVHRSQVWMINFVDNNWDFPGERDRLSGNTDTIFLRNGHIQNVTITDFSSRRRVFEFLQGGSVHESNVARIYFCCTRLPGAYGRQASAPSPGQSDRYSMSFLVDGRVVEYPLSYINSRKTGFTDGLQINTHDLWLINFVDDSFDFPGERQRLDRRMDTIFLRNGRILYDNVVEFNERTGNFMFNKLSPIHESQIKRLYFCCQEFPDAFRNKRQIKRPRRY